MGDEMLTLFYDKEILNYTKAAEGKNISEYEKEAEFRLFRDYFGLIHLIQSCEVGPRQRGYGEMLGYPTSVERNRLDSVDSDVWSDTSSGGRDFDTSLDGVQPSLGIPHASPSLAPGFSPSRNIILRDGADTGLRGRPVLADVSKIAVGRRNQNVCVFCRNNGESKKVYSSHVLKDSQGNTVCPILRAYTCPLCKASGDESHTIKYCPKNKNNRLDK